MNKSQWAGLIQNYLINDEEYESGGDLYSYKPMSDDWLEKKSLAIAERILSEREK